MTRPYDARTDRPLSRNRHHPLITRSPYHRNPTYPCWCGETMTDAYRQFRACCWRYLLENAPLLYMDLGVDTTKPPTEYLRTLRRADGSEIGGEYALLVAMDDNDWGGAEEEAFYHDEQQEYWLDTWVLVRRQSRMMGPEPEEDEEDDDEPGADQGAVPVADGEAAGGRPGVDE